MRDIAASVTPHVEVPSFSGIAQIRGEEEAQRLRLAARPPRGPEPPPHRPSGLVLFMKSTIHALLVLAGLYFCVVRPIARILVTEIAAIQIAENASASEAE